MTDVEHPPAERPVLPVEDRTILAKLNKMGGEGGSS